MRVICLCLLLAACAADPVADAQRPRALVDAYLIAHGMAASYAQAPQADPAVVEQLGRLDIRAAQAVRSLAREPGNLSATAEAVAALTDYAARQSATQ